MQARQRGDLDRGLEKQPVGEIHRFFASRRGVAALVWQRIMQTSSEKLRAAWNRQAAVVARKINLGWWIETASVPLVTVGLAISILGEVFTVWHALGTALVLGGVWLFTRKEKPRVKVLEENTA